MERRLAARFEGADLGSAPYYKETGKASALYGINQHFFITTIFSSSAPQQHGAWSNHTTEVIGSDPSTDE